MKITDILLLLALSAFTYLFLAGFMDSIPEDTRPVHIIIQDKE